jgi:hypothetical protein
MQTQRCRAGRAQPWAAHVRLGTLALLAAASGLLAFAAAAVASPAVAHPTVATIVHMRSLASRPESGRQRAGKAPRIATQPTPAYAAPGTEVRFAATATGSPKPTVQWQISTDHGARWRNIRGARGRSLSLTAVLAKDGDRFRAVFKNRYGKANTRGAALTVVAGYAKPVIQTEPQSLTAVLGTEASFTAAAAGDPTPTVQWQLSDNGGTTWSDVPGATQTTLALTTSAAMNGYDYRAVFTNVLGSVDTTAATLTVATGSVPAITEQPQSEDVGSGSTVSLTAAASGSPAPSVQWQVSVNHGASWSNISGATATTYAFTAAASQNLNEYQAVFTNELGSASTEPAIVGVGYVLTSNWSGYASVLNDTQYSAVSGSWTVPNVNCTQASNSSSSQWVGIDGATSDTVEQVGTYSDCAGPSGTTPTYGAWYEMLGDNAVSGGAQVNVTTMTPADTISAGDVITASVSVNGSDQWTLTIADSTSPRMWSFTAPLITWSAPAESSAEWIVERPETCTGNNQCSLTSLADFGTAAFTNASATAGGTSQTIGELDSAPIEMIRSDADSTLLAGPPTLNVPATGFSVPWVGSS